MFKQLKECMEKVTSDWLQDSPSKLLFTSFYEKGRIWYEIKSHLVLFSTHPFIIDEHKVLFCKYTSCLMGNLCPSSLRFHVPHCVMLEKAVAAMQGWFPNPHEADRPVLLIWLEPIQSTIITLSSQEIKQILVNPYRCHQWIQLILHYHYIYDIWKV